MENLNAISLIERKLKQDYIYLLSALLVMLIGIALTGIDNLLFLRLGMFGFFTGFVFVVLLLLQINDASKHYNRWHDAILSAYRKEQGLPLLPHEENNIPVPTNEPEIKHAVSQSHIVYLDKVDDEGQHQTELRKFDEKNKPPQEFIVACHGLAMANDKNHVTERKVIEWLKSKPTWDKWNVWLDEMEKVSILKPEDSRPHAARYWDIEHMQLNTALEIFEYEPIEVNNGY